MSPAIVRTEVIEPKRLTSTQLGALTDALYAVHCEIFDGVTRDGFAAYVVESPADDTHIQVSYGEDGEIAGYTAIHAFRRTFRGDACTVSRAEAGLRRAYRGNGSSGAFFLERLLRTQWKFGGAHYYLGCLVHPSSYTAFARDGVDMWPAPGVPVPEDVFAFMMQLGEEFHLERVDPSRPLVRHVGWITRDTEVERRYWQAADLRPARYFIEQNPGYGRGHGLLTLVDFNPASLGKSVVMWGSARLKKSVQRTVGALERGVLRPRMDAGTAEDLLVAIEAATGLDLDAIRDMGLIGTRHPVPARTVLFRAGERADVMYILLEGSIFVLDTDASGREIVIDQVGPKTLVGEMALLTGEPRMATVRAAVDSVFLKITREELDRALATVPALEDALWSNIGRRVFRAQLRALPAFSDLPWDAREAWFDRAASRALAAGERLTLDQDGAVLLALGKLHVEGPSGWMSLSAPALFTARAGASLTALPTARLTLLPPSPEADVGGSAGASELERAAGREQVEIPEKSPAQG